MLEMAFGVNEPNSVSASKAEYMTNCTGTACMPLRRLGADTSL
jgi:hypothetical protein